MDCPNKYKEITIRGRRTREHVVVAEKALGKRLPRKAEVHHLDGDKGNNHPANLVVCQDRAYHFLLHARQRAYDAVGDANALKCRYCGFYDTADALLIRQRLTGERVGQVIAYHAACSAQRTAARRAVS